jgi:hypothetical protein
MDVALAFTGSVRSCEVPRCGGPGERAPMLGKDDVPDRVRVRIGDLGAISLPDDLNSVESRGDGELSPTIFGNPIKGCHQRLRGVVGDHRDPDPRRRIARHSASPLRSYTGANWLTA